MEPAIELVDCESNEVATFPVQEKPEGEASRREAALMRSLEQYLQKSGHTVGRFKISPRGQATPLRTDTYDSTEGVLYEAKATSTRGNIRTAIGKLLDYSRSTPSGTRLEVLLPQRPNDDW